MYGKIINLHKCHGEDKSKYLHGYRKFSNLKGRAEFQYLKNTLRFKPVGWLE